MLRRHVFYLGRSYQLWCGFRLGQTVKGGCDTAFYMLYQLESSSQIPCHSIGTQDCLTGIRFRFSFYVFLDLWLYFFLDFYEVRHLCSPISLATYSVPSCLPVSRYISQSLALSVALWSDTLFSPHLSLYSFLRGYQSPFLKFPSKFTFPIFPFWNPHLNSKTIIIISIRIIYSQKSFLSFEF